MKSIIARLLNTLYQSPLFRLFYWYLRAPFSNYAAFAFFKERTARDLRTNGEFRVLIGPYKGMKYTKHGSSISLNCLVGCYEMEVWPVIASLADSNYDVIIDVGCAEGYHACGMAIVSNKRVLAYDISPTARQDCRRMAKLNNLADRVEIGEYLSCENLEEICNKNRTFLFCDIDYYELELLDLKKVPSLVSTDILVETHGHCEGSVEDTLPVIRERFQQTHEIIVFSMTPRYSHLMRVHGDPRTDVHFSLGKVLDEPLCHAFLEERGYNNWLWLKARPHSG